MSSFNFKNLTLEEVEIIENIIGLSIDEAFDEGKPKGKALKAFVWVVRKRTNPNYSIEEAQKLTLDEALSMIKGDETKKE